MSVDRSETDCIVDISADEEVTTVGHLMSQAINQTFVQLKR
jgi:hypothetical protein